MKKKLIVIIGVVAAILVAAFAMITSDLSDVGGMELRGINLNTLSDGLYTGTFERGRFTNTVVVAVENNRIVSIEIEDDVVAAWITNASSEVFRRVIEVQNTHIDAVAGATVTTNAYLLAIENALEN